MKTDLKFADLQHFLHIAFPCQYCVYNLYFLKHLYICPFTASEEGVFEAEEYRTEMNNHYQIHYMLRDDFVCTWTVDAETAE